VLDLLRRKYHGAQSRVSGRVRRFCGQHVHWDYPVRSLNTKGATTCGPDFGLRNSPSGARLAIDMFKFMIGELRRDTEPGETAIFPIMTACALWELTSVHRSGRWYGGNFREKIHE
jgi:hypothetical protein